MKFDPSPTAIWKKYERDRDYKRSIGLYDRVRRNEAFYLGSGRDCACSPSTR